MNGTEVEQVSVEYVPERVDLDDGLDGEFREEFKKIFEKFSFQYPLGSLESASKMKKEADLSDSEDEEQQDNRQKEKGLSKKRKKHGRRMKIAEVKRYCSRPDVVEVWDATAADPKLLVFLKAYRNTVPVPRHWCQKRNSCRVSGELESSHFNYQISLLRQELRKLDKLAMRKRIVRSLQKQSERMQPRMKKMDIDYPALYDAFFKYQTKPKLTTHGDLYYEGKEFEVKQLMEMKPCTLSYELREALGIPDVASPPYLRNMQRYGAPPSYPNLKIPGFNAPIPQEADKPHVVDTEPVDKTRHWGDLEEAEDQIEEEELEDGIESVESVDTLPKYSYWH